MKARKIIYWIATLWLALGMVSTGIVQVFKLKAEMEYITHLGYPDYFLSLVGIWKILGAIAVLIPRSPLLKEYAYAGMFFLMTGAVYSHIAFGDRINDIFPSLLLLTLTLVSWFTRPVQRRLVLAKAA
jgi:uncharacterized membrane protein YphA (DoxX/SURF4 family)